ncbi:hypothetical protein AC781_04600 [Akkermansia glycaniphila]|nr:hypothetical protein AC781_04600 [Akkermansia glycaniphila]
MTLRLVQSYGAPAALSDYTVYGSILQDGETVPVSATGADASGILLTIPPLYPGSHPYNLHLKHNTSGTDYLFLQGNCDVSELIGPDTLDNTAVEQITVALKDDLSGVTVTVQIDSETTAAAWEEIEAVARKTEGLQETISNLIPEARIEIAQATGIAKNDIATATATSLESITQGATSAAETAVTTVTVESANIVQASKQDLDNYTLVEKQVLVAAANKGTQDIATAVTTGTGTINNAVATGKTSIDNYVAVTQADFVRKSQANIWSGVQTFNNNVVLNGTTTLTSTNIAAQSAIPAQYGGISPYLRTIDGSWVPMLLTYQSCANRAYRPVRPGDDAGTDLLIYRWAEREAYNGFASWGLMLGGYQYVGGPNTSSWYIHITERGDTASVLASRPEVGLEVICGLHVAAHWQFHSAAGGAARSSYYTRIHLPINVLNVRGIACINYHKSLDWWAGFHGYLMVLAKSGEWYRIGHYCACYENTKFVNKSRRSYVSLGTLALYPAMKFNGGIVTSSITEYYQSPPLPNQVQGYNGLMGGTLRISRPSIRCTSIDAPGDVIDEGLLYGCTISLPAAGGSITAVMACSTSSISTSTLWTDAAINWQTAISSAAATINLSALTGSATTATIVVQPNATGAALTIQVAFYSSDKTSTIYIITINQPAQS